MNLIKSSLQKQFHLQDPYRKVQVWFGTIGFIVAEIITNIHDFTRIATFVISKTVLRLIHRNFLIDDPDDQAHPYFYKSLLVSFSEFVLSCLYIH